MARKSPWRSHIPCIPECPFPISNPSKAIHVISLYTYTPDLHMYPCGGWDTDEALINQSRTVPKSCSGSLPELYEPAPSCSAPWVWVYVHVEHHWVIPVQDVLSGHRWTVKRDSNIRTMHRTTFLREDNPQSTCTCSCSTSTIVGNR